MFQELLRRMKHKKNPITIKSITTRAYVILFALRAKVDFINKKKVIFCFKMAHFEKF
jgi:hypothetical protein